MVQSTINSKKIKEDFEKIKNLYLQSIKKNQTLDLDELVAILKENEVNVTKDDKTLVIIAVGRLCCELGGMDTIEEMLENAGSVEINDFCRPIFDFFSLQSKIRIQNMPEDIYTDLIDLQAYNAMQERNPVIFTLTQIERAKITRDKAGLGNCIDALNAVISMQNKQFPETLNMICQGALIEIEKLK